MNQDAIYTNGFLDAFNTVKAGGESAVLNNVLKGRHAHQRGRDSVGDDPPAVRLQPDAELGGRAGLFKLATRLQTPAGSTVAQSVTQISAGLPFFFIPYPQFQSLNVLDSNDFSTYNALEAQVTRRFSNGISFNLAYTWSKALDTRSFDPTLTVVGTGNASTAADTPFDINNRRLNYAPADFDRRHNLQWNFVTELPFGKGKHFLSNAGEHAESRGRRLGSDGLRPCVERTAVQRFRGDEHGEQRQSIDGELHRLQPRRWLSRSSIRRTG